MELTSLRKCRQHVRPESPRFLASRVPSEQSSDDVPLASLAGPSLRASFASLSPVLPSSGFVEKPAPFSPTRVGRSAQRNRVGLKGAVCSGKTADTSTGTSGASEGHREVLDRSRRGLSGRSCCLIVRCPARCPCFDPFPEPPFRRLFTRPRRRHAYAGGPGHPRRLGTESRRGRS
jgi:hypothetical protein